MTSKNFTVTRLAKHPCKGRVAGHLCGDVWRAVKYVDGGRRRIATACVTHGHECDSTGKQLAGPVQLDLLGNIQ